MVTLMKLSFKTLESIKATAMIKFRREEAFVGLNMFEVTDKIAELVNAILVDYDLDQVNLYVTVIQKDLEWEVGMNEFLDAIEEVIGEDMLTKFLPILTYFIQEAYRYSQEQQ